MPAVSLFRKAAEDALRAIGEVSYFDGAAEPTYIHIEHGVQNTGIGADEATYRGTYAANYDIATILSTLVPQTGKTFTQAGATYKLGPLVRDNGYTKRYVVLKT